MKPPPLSHPSDRERVVGLLCALAVIALFSSFTLVSRIGLSSSLSMMDIAALRFTVAGLVMLPVLVHFGWAGVRWRDAVPLALTGGLGFALLAYTGFSLAPASHAGVLLHGTLALTTFALTWLGTRATVRGWRAAGLLLILVGIVAMGWDSVASSTPRQLFGDGALLLASVCWSAYGLLARKLGLRAAHAASIVAVLSMIFFVPLYALLPDAGATIVVASWDEVAVQAVFQGVLIGVASVFLYTRAVASLGAAETSLFTAAVPCVTTVAAVGLLGETPSVAAMLGVVLVTGGMISAMNAR